MKNCNSIERDIFNAINFHRFDEFTELITTVFQLNLNARNHNDDTFLIFACQYPHMEFVEKLIELGSDINAVNDDKDTGLIVAAKNGHVHVVQYLIDNGANINLQNKEGKSALYFATSFHQLEVLELLLLYNANVNLVNQDNYSPLHIAALSCPTKITQLLLTSKEIEINLQNNTGQTALILASRLNRVDVTHLLIQSGANIHIKNYHNQNALNIAIEHNSHDTVSLLNTFYDYAELQKNPINLICNNKKTKI